MPAPIFYQKDAALGRGISQAGSALGNALQFNEQIRRQKEKILEDDYNKDQQNKRYGSILQETLGSLGENASTMDTIRAYTSAMQQGVPSDIAQNMSTLQRALREPSNKPGLGLEQKDSLKELLLKFGMPEDQADRESDLYIALPTGGKTQYANMFFDRMQRGDFSSQAQAPGQVNQSQDVFKSLPGEIKQKSIVSSQDRNGDVSSVVEEKETFKWPKLDTFKGMNRKEISDTQKYLLNANSKDYQEIVGKRRGYDDELLRLSEMEKLNNSGKLPSGLQNLNINWKTGDIRFPKLANEETQAFVKMINDFTTKAKDTYGGRVTNFELGAFMRRLPTLANSEEGRRLILDQMQNVAGMNKLYYDSKKAVYDKYKIKNIDTQETETIAEKIRQEDEKALEDKYKNSLKTQEVYEARTMAPEGKMPARAPNGQIVYIWTDQLDKATSKGYKAL